MAIGRLTGRVRAAPSDPASRTPAAPAGYDKKHTVPIALGGCLIDDLDHVSQALVIAEGEVFR